jgi:hypothetical protein
MPVVISGSTGITTPTYNGTNTAEYLVPVTQFKNRIINGACVIDQRNAGASVTGNDGVFVVDRWVNEASQTSKLTIQQNAGSVTPPAGFTNYIGYTSSSSYSVAAGDYFACVQRVEGFNVADFDFGKSTAKTVTLSFWVRSSLTGTFGGALRNANATRSYPFAYTISSANTWEQKSVTIAGDTTGTWLTTNGNGMSVIFGLGMGSTYSGTAGAWASSNFLSATGATSVVGTNGATFYITGVQLEVGSTATSFDYRPYGTELALCQRYFQRIIDPPLRGVVSGSSAAGRAACSLATWMRVAPSTTISQVGTTGNARFFDGTVSTGAISSITVSYVTTTRIEYDIALTASGYTNGFATCLYIDSPGNYSTAFNLSAEL